MATKKRPKRADSPRGARLKKKPPTRLQKVEEWLAAGQTYGVVVESAQTTFGVSHRTAERDIAQVYHRWETEEKDERPARRARMRAELWQRYWAAVGSASDSHMHLSSAKILERLCKLDGLDAPDKLSVHHSDTTGDKLAAMTPAEREKRIAELLAKRAGGGQGNG